MVNFGRQLGVALKNGKSGKGSGVKGKCGCPVCGTREGKNLIITKKCRKEGCKTPHAWCDSMKALADVLARADPMIRQAVAKLRFWLASQGDLGEGSTVGRRGGGANVQSSFELSSGSNTAGNDESLGEIASTGRRGGGASSSSTFEFALSSGSNTAGNDESLA